MNLVIIDYGSGNLKSVENAFKNYEAFRKGYKKSYLSWLNSAKREATRQKRITQIINLCEANIKTRP